MHRRLPENELPDLGGLTLGDFWSWAYSDVLSNLNRSALAEFLVAAALALVEEPRVEWDAVDLQYQGHRLEVKAAAYLQSWTQAALSTIRFDIAKKRGWDPITNTYLPEPVRSADCYVFCLFPLTDEAAAQRRILDARDWEFYIVPTARLERDAGNQKSLGLKAVRRLSPPVQYRNLEHHIEAALGIAA